MQVVLRLYCRLLLPTCGSFDVRQNMDTTQNTVWLSIARLQVHIRPQVYCNPGASVRSSSGKSEENLTGFTPCGGYFPFLETHLPLRISGPSGFMVEIVGRNICDLHYTSAGVILTYNSSNTFLINTFWAKTKIAGLLPVIRKVEAPLPQEAGCPKNYIEMYSVTCFPYCLREAALY